MENGSEIGEKKNGFKGENKFNYKLFKILFCVLLISMGWSLSLPESESTAFPTSLKIYAIR